MKRLLHSALAATMLVATAGAASARIVTPAEKRFFSYSGEVPPCGDPDVLSTITDRFAQTESEYWDSHLQIITYDRVRSIGIRPWGLDHIPRTFCMARAVLSDHSVHEVSYSIGENLGFSSFGDGVTWCVAGLDREYAYAPNCKDARP
ncbi:hypothetical protein P7D22_14895 [Lichenihabitans sp. Uapishka_5]|uniref:hypothetical protein n=1 Tax=Lichenihabitans sp. Uapishka_5 TaxID=3037302 RepID=UPI0029E7E5AF|nr:hypothetical protein [Lichenihabitans sp. Uapishka_5]MDX7952455.1 hypothetical protein [Lichenihabitans sp. Uapishka_5]